MFKGKTLNDYTKSIFTWWFKKKWWYHYELLYEQSVCIKIETYCLKCRKHTKNIKPQISSASNGKTMMISKCAACNSRKCKFIKRQKAKGLLSKLGIKTPLNKILLLGDILF